MRFRYQQLNVQKPLISLRGRLARPRPLVLTSVRGPKGIFVEYALLDTGADDTVFPANAAAKIGVDLTNAPAGDMGGVGGGAGRLLYAQVDLRLSDGRESREWTAWVGFTSAPLRQPLLGFAGCLQFFHANFLGDQEAVELTVNTLYTGS